jgi:hypothetical protein
VGLKLEKVVTELDFHINQTLTHKQFRRLCELVDQDLGGRHKEWADHYRVELEPGDCCVEPLVAWLPKEGIEYSFEETFHYEEDS